LIEKEEKMMKITTMAKNQTICTMNNDMEFLQSYKSVVVARIRGKVYLDKNTYDYSKTTSKYRNRYLNVNNAEFKENLQNGKYTIVDNLEKLVENEYSIILDTVTIIGGNI